LGGVGSDVAAWAQAHEACFEAAPLVEQGKTGKVQVGFTLSLYARLPLDPAPGADRRAAAAEVWERLKQIVQSLVPEEEGRVRVEIEAPRTAAFFRPENQMKPEIGLNARVSHSGSYLTEVTPGDRDALSAVLKRLADMGLKQGHW
jgi:hypothetical protein